MLKEIANKATDNILIIVAKDNVTAEQGIVFLVINISGLSFFLIFFYFSVFLIILI